MVTGVPSGKLARQQEQSALDKMVLLITAQTQRQQFFVFLLYISQV
jgi:hypothetical protein